MKNQLIFMSVIVVFLFQSITGCLFLREREKLYTPEPGNKNSAKSEKWIEEAENINADQYASAEYASARNYLAAGNNYKTNTFHVKNYYANRCFSKSQTNAKKAYYKAAPRYMEKLAAESRIYLLISKKIYADAEMLDEYVKANKLLEQSKEHLSKKEFKGSIDKVKEARIIAEQTFDIAFKKRTESETVKGDGSDSNLLKDE